MPNITGHTELVGLMAYPIRHTQSPTTHNLAYDKNGDDVIQLAFEVDNDSLKDAVQSIRALKMLVPTSPCRTKQLFTNIWTKLMKLPNYAVPSTRL